jgi:hypothetical protein
MNGPMAYKKLPFFKSKTWAFFVGKNELQRISIGSLGTFSIQSKANLKVPFLTHVHKNNPKIKKILIFYVLMKKP